jgi:hypothetical protein
MPKFAKKNAIFGAKKLFQEKNQLTIFDFQLVFLEF